MNRPREGNRPGTFSSKELDPRVPEKYPLVVKAESGLAEPVRNTARNRFLAKQNGWTEAEFLHWVDTGDPPTRSVVKETPATRPDEIDDDERAYHR